MKNRNINLKELRQKMKDLQEQIDTKEKDLNIEVGAWVRKQTNLDSRNSTKLPPRSYQK